MLSVLGCIGDDIVDDFVEPEIRFISIVDTLGVGETVQIDVQFFNNVGQEEAINLQWSSSDEAIALISEEGLLWGRQKGEVIITVNADYSGTQYTSQRKVIIDEETVEAPTMREGSLRTTSSYTLEGGFVLSQNEDGVTLSFGEDYLTDDVLPGLYVYLTNNASTIKDALEIGEVTVFKGEHSYDIKDVQINDYSHVLYFCKPFNVKVGDGAFE